jgi:hypothetical protein
MRFVVVAKEHDGGALELRYIGEWPLNSLPDLAQACLSDGFDLMYEFDAKPLMEELGERFKSGECVWTHPNMQRFWVLNKEEENE